MLRPPYLDYRSFDDSVNELLDRAPRSLLAHELTHVVQQSTATRQGRERLLHRLEGLDPALWLALTSNSPLTERQSEKVAQHLAANR